VRKFKKSIRKIGFPNEESAKRIEVGSVKMAVSRPAHQYPAELPPVPFQGAAQGTACGAYPAREEHPRLK